MKIMVGVDGTAASRQALRWALGMAGLAGAEVEAARSWTYPSSPQKLEPAEAMDQHCQAELAAVVDEARRAADFPREVKLVVLRGPANVSLPGWVDKRPPSLLVVGRRGDERSVPRVLGSVSRRLVDSAAVPLVVVSDETPRPAPGTGGPMRFLVGYDGSPDSRRALQWASELARATGAEILLAQVVSVVGMAEAGVAVTEGDEAVLRGAADELVADDVPCSTVSVVGDPRRAIEDLADRHGADLIVVGPRGAGGLAKLVLGTTAAYLAEHADAPVAIIPTSWKPGS